MKTKNWFFKTIGSRNKTNVLKCTFGAQQFDGFERFFFYNNLTFKKNLYVLNRPNYPFGLISSHNLFRVKIKRNKKALK